MSQKNQINKQTKLARHLNLKTVDLKNRNEFNSTQENVKIWQIKRHYTARSNNLEDFRHKQADSGYKPSSQGFCPKYFPIYTLIYTFIYIFLYIFIYIRKLKKKRYPEAVPTKAVARRSNCPLPRGKAGGEYDSVKDFLSALFAYPAAKPAGNPIPSRHSLVALTLRQSRRGMRSPEFTGIDPIGIIMRIFRFG
jgi:hypothetical protein